MYRVCINIVREQMLASDAQIYCKFKLTLYNRIFRHKINSYTIHRSH